MQTDLKFITVSKSLYRRINLFFDRCMPHPNKAYIFVSLCFLFISNHVIAQSVAPPVITPKPNIVVKLDPTGNYTFQITDLATVNTPGTNVPVIDINPQKLTCADLGNKLVTVTATIYVPTPSAVSFSGIVGLVSDPAGNLVVADVGSTNLKYIGTRGNVTRMTYGDNSPYSDGSGTQTPAPYVVAVARDKAGNIYWAANNAGEHDIFEITPQGIITNIISNYNGLPTSQDGIGVSASLSDIVGMIVDDQGTIYITESDNKFRRIDPDRTITTIAGSSFGGSGFRDGTGGIALFNNPTGIAMDANGNFYIADKNNSAIRMVTPAGVVSTFAGGASGFTDGTGILAKFSSISGLTIDAQGNLYVADAGNNAIRKVSPSGIVTTIAGNGTAGLSNGNGTAATFSNPVAIAVDGSGTLYVDDKGNNVVRKITSSGVVTTYAGSGTPGDAIGNILPVVAASTEQIPVIVAGTLTVNPYPNTPLSIGAPCPAVLPDYTKVMTYADNCSSVVTFTQSPAAGTPVTSTAPITVTITARDGVNATSTISFVVTPDGTPLPVPAVSITVAANTICAGAPVTFTASSPNAGNLAYQWQVNGVNVGTGKASFTSTMINDKDIVTCILFVGSGCTVSVISNAIAMNVNANLTPAVTIRLVSAGFCLGQNTVFMATPVNGGSAPSYQWLVNNLNAGINSPVFQSTTLVNDDLVTCIITNNDNTCLAQRTGLSNLIPVIVSPGVLPSLTIKSSVTGEICAGTPVTFTVTAKNEGVAPVYQWQVNGKNTGVTAPVFSSSTLANNDAVTCTLAASGPCVASPVVTSNCISVNVGAQIITAVNISPQQVFLYRYARNFFGISGRHSPESNLPMAGKWEECGNKQHKLYQHLIKQRRPGNLFGKCSRLPGTSHQPAG
jgi:hypothetical protein